VSNNIFENQLNPPNLRGMPSQIPDFPAYQWVKQLPRDKKIYMALWEHWHSTDLPTGFDIYIISFHTEALNLDWLAIQSSKLQTLIIVLHDGYNYDYQIPNVQFISYFYWHEQLRKIVNWYGIYPRVRPEYKFGAICNRIQTNKVYITTWLLEHAQEQSLVILGDWLEEKNVNFWQPVGNTVLDNLTEIFRKKYLGKVIRIDNFTNKDNYQHLTSDPWHPACSNVAVHFTNESIYSSYIYGQDKPFIYPGPFLNEKTMKALISGSTIIPVGQFETYKTLSYFGLNFDYNFDTSWDLDPGNHSRMQSIIAVCQSLASQSIDQLENHNADINRFNQNWIESGSFYTQVEKYNQQSLDKLFEIIRT